MSARRARPRLLAIPLLLVLPMLDGCCSQPAPEPHGPLPDWRGPAVHCEHLGDGALAVTLTAPTAGHTFTLQEVALDGERAALTFAHAPPAADFVAQVVTPHRVEVPAERLGAAKVVCVHVASGGAAPQLAIATARP